MSSFVENSQPPADGNRGIVSLRPLLRCLASYKAASLEAVSPIRLSFAGLEYRGPNHATVCTRCRLVLSVCELGDDPVEKHRTEAPSCPIANGLIDDKSIDAVTGHLASRLGISCSPGTSSKDLADTPVIANKASTSAVVNVSSNPDANEAFRRILTRAIAKSRAVIDRSCPDYTKLSSEQVRLSTFHDWPTEKSRIVDIFQLAKSGFYYTGKSDIVQCVYCRGFINGWAEGDQADIEHRRLFPNCPFVEGLRDCDSSDRPQSRDNLRFTSSVNETRVSSAALPTSNTSVLPSAALPTSNTSVLPHPRHSNYKTLDSRIHSFDGQRIPAGQQPDVLAIAGLFYVGPQDNVRCFHCDGGLKNWQPTDVPWIEHKRWFPRCAYVQLFPDGPTANDARAVRFADPEAASNASQPRRDFVDFNEPGRVQYRVELREIKARMDTPLVKTVLNMGHSREIVRLAIEKRLTTTGDDFPSAASLIEAVFAMEDPQPSTLHVGGAAGTDNSNIPTHTSSSSSMDNVTAHGPTGDEGVEPAEKLMLENQQLKDSRICKKCRIMEVNTVLLPCGHLVCCDQCAKSLSACPACRQLIKGTVKTFIA